MTTLFRKLWRTIRNLLIFLFLTSMLSVIMFRFVMPPLTPLMVIRFVEQVVEGHTMRFEYEKVALDEISDHLKKAVIASEDQKFFDHWGFDIGAIQKAYKSNSKGNKTFKGGSTISQQVAKNVFLWPGRSYFRKACEAYFTVLIEVFWSKRRILEVYLNVIEMGNGIYGSESASRHYFKKSAAHLGAGDAALLAAILPNPRNYDLVKPSIYLSGRKLWILNNMRPLPASI